MKRNRSSLGISFTNIKPLQITEVARDAGIRMEELRLYGNHKAKVSLRLTERVQARPNGKLILVSSMTPAPQGEGKTVIAIALTEALGLLKKKVMFCSGQPSPDRLFSRRGGSVGAGYAQLLPGDEINFHFTGDYHAAQSAANFLAAVIDNHRKRGDERRIDPAALYWRRATDAPETGHGDSQASEPVSSSEIISILTLAKSLADLKARIGRIVVALSRDGTAVTAQDLRAAGPMALLLRDAIEPNLVQTLDGQPCLVHMGAAGESSLGNPSIVAIQMALRLADYVIAESAFGTDAGLEKFMDVIAPSAGFEPHAVVLVATLRAIKSHGYENLERHVSNVRAFGVEPIVVLNRFPDDAEADVRNFFGYLRMKQIEIISANPVQKGAEGALELAESLVKTLPRKGPGSKPAVTASQDIFEKCRAIARSVFGASDARLSTQAKRDLESCVKLGLKNAPLNIAKTPYSLSDDPARKGAPRDWTLEITGFRPQVGAGIVTAFAGTRADGEEAFAESELGLFDIDDTGKMLETAP